MKKKFKLAQAITAVTTGVLSMLFVHSLSAALPPTKNTFGQDFAADPMEQLQHWLKEYPLPSSRTRFIPFSLSTIYQNRPSSRVVPLEKIQDQSLVFSTNPKFNMIKQLAANANCAANFYWTILHQYSRQIRIEGTVIALSGFQPKFGDIIDMDGKLTSVRQAYAIKPTWIQFSQAMKDKNTSHYQDISYLLKDGNWQMQKPRWIKSTIR